MEYFLVSPEKGILRKVIATLNNKSAKSITVWVTIYRQRVGSMCRSDHCCNIC